jgi:glucan biosynthesis protein C
VIGNHLWFLPFLFIYSLLSLAIIWIGKKMDFQSINGFLRKMISMRGIIILMILISIISAAIEPLWPNYLDWVDFVFWFFIYMLGMFIFHEELLIQKVKKAKPVFLIIFVISTLAALFLLQKEGDSLLSIPQYSVVDLIFQFFWAMIKLSITLLFLSLGQSFLNGTNRVWQSGSKLIMPFYLFHNTLLIIIGFFIVQLTLPIFVKFLIICMGTILWYALIHILLIKPFPKLQFLLGTKL